MEARWKSFNAGLIASLPRKARTKLLEKANEHLAAEWLEAWYFWARKEQRPPDGRWRTWLYLGGRGAGKTRAGAEWIADGVRNEGFRNVALVGATHHDARAVMIEGVSGLMRAAKGASYEPSNQRVRWPNGAVATVLSAEEPDGIRGHQFDAAWGDEFCKWRAPQEALDMLRMALRVGKHPRLMLTTTPRNIAALKALMGEKGVTRTHSRTDANKANLADGFFEDLAARYGGTRLGRQELDAEIIEDNDRALWKRGWIEQARRAAAPEMTRVVIAVDPPASREGCECGIVAAGRAGDEAFVLADRSAGGLSPHGWAARVAAAYEDFEADAIVAEANQGGDMVRQVLADQSVEAPIKLVHATRGKIVRAQPAASLYEQGRIHHVGVFAELEDQMCNYDGEGESPDRMDALVWALAELFPPVRRSRPRARAL
jgi:phage terminase large subunit-like protein